MRKSRIGNIFLEIAIYTALFVSFFRTVHNLPKAPSNQEWLLAVIVSGLFLAGTFHLVCEMRRTRQQIAEDIIEAAKEKAVNALENTRKKIDPKDIINIQVGDMKYGVEKKDAARFANAILEEVEKEDYSILKEGDTLWRKNPENGELEYGITDEVFTHEGHVAYFSIDFPESDDWSCFNGKALGRQFFLDRKRAEKSEGNI